MSSKYVTRRCCSELCPYEEFGDNGPCYGEVSAVDEIYTEDDYWWIHACEGHLTMHLDGKYKPISRAEMLEKVLLYKMRQKK